MNTRFAFFALARPRTVSVLAGLALVLPLSAQVTPSESESPSETNSESVQLDTVVVTGDRLSSRNSITERQSNNALVDALGADELGNLPDQNLSEALGRIPGVTTVEDEGVGRYATVRGLKSDYVNVTLDGAGFSASARPWDADTARSTNLQAISPDIISKVQVFKTMTPDLDGSAIAGTINLQTRSAFDVAGTYSGAQFGLGYFDGASIPDSSVDPSVKATAIVSTRFGDQDQFGIVLNGSYRHTDRVILKRDIQYTWAKPEIPAFPGGNWDAFTAEQATRTGGYAKFEFKPSANLHAFASVNYFDEQEKWQKNEHMLWNSGSYDATAGTFDGFAALMQPREAEFGTDGALTASTGADWSNAQGDTIEFIGVHSSSSYYLIDRRAQWISSWGGIDGTYVADGRDWNFTMDSASAAKFSNPATYYFSEFRATDNTTGKEIDSLKLDWSHNMDAGVLGWAFQAGAKYTGQQVDFTEAAFRGDRSDRTGFNIYKYADDLQASNVIGSLGTPLIFGSLAGVQADIAAEGLEGYKKHFQRWRTNYANGKDYRTDENVYAGYAMARFAAQRVSTTFGARYEFTDWTGASRLEQHENADFVERGGDYGHLLPSVNVTYRLSNAWNLRAAFSESVGRPKATDLVPYESTPDFNVDNGIWRFSRGNPNLKARESNNYDVAFEYYFDGGNSALTAGLFRKDIRHEIYDLTTTESVSFVDPDTGAELTATAEVTQPQNAGSAKVDGFEIGLLVDRLHFLPAPFDGLGLQANFTALHGEMDLIDGNGEVFRSLDQLHHQPEQAFNFVLFYEGERFSTRVAAKHLSSQIYSLADTAAQDLNQGALTRFDFHAEYRFARNWEAFIDVNNLTDASTFYYGGPWDETVEYGRTVWAGVNLKF